jgi:hypothetical protein
MYTRLYIYIASVDRDVAYHESYAAAVPFTISRDPGMSIPLTLLIKCTTVHNFERIVGLP